MYRDKLEKQIKRLGYDSLHYSTGYNFEKMPPRCFENESVGIVVFG